jgi:hypothetical protein
VVALTLENVTVFEAETATETATVSEVVSVAEVGVPTVPKKYAVADRRQGSRKGEKFQNVRVLEVAAVVVITPVEA